MSNITRWNPFEEISSLWPRDMFNRDFFGRMRPDGAVTVEWSPRCDISETDAEIVIHAELPGVEAKDMQVTVEDGVLTVRGEKRTETKEEDKDKGTVRSERFFGSFERRISLPATADEANIQANLKDGVLEVRLPKVAAAKPEPRTVEIKTG